MGLQQIINQKPWLIRALVGFVAAVAIATAIWQVFGGRHRAENSYHRAFYSDDDGKTWFLDDVVKITPFDHNGRQAVRAAVFRCPNTGPFVAYLQKYSDQAKAKLDAALATGPSSGGAGMLELMAPMDVKRPGDSNWISGSGGTNAISSEYRKVTNPTCPDGSADLIPVTPADSDSGATN